MHTVGKHAKEAKRFVVIPAKSHGGAVRVVGWRWTTGRHAPMESHGGNTPFHAKTKPLYSFDVNILVLMIDSTAS
jgi:hypothetical protein